MSFLDGDNSDDNDDEDAASTLHRDLMRLHHEMRTHQPLAVRKFILRQNSVRP